MSENKIKIGDKIKVDLSGKVIDLCIVESIKGASTECVSASSPLAQSILNSCCGETIQYQSPRGLMSCRVIEMLAS